ncbi:MAG: DUF4476 domain-containing protein [Chitinophagaceae bacterium]
MKFTSFSIILLFSAIQSFAQQNHFIYIQSDTKSTFTVNVNEHSYKSSDIGYVIIPKLQNNTYNLSVSFTDASITPLSFPCKVNNNDQGFLLKNYGEKGWALMNLQSMDLITASNTPVIEKKNSAFSDMLSDVVDDSTLNKPAVTTVSNNEQNPEIKKAEPIVENTLIENVPQVISIVTNGNNTVTKIAEITDQAGTHYTFLDFDGTKTDTIAVSIPTSKKVEIADTKKEEVLVAPVVEEKVKTVEEDSTSVAENTNQSGNPFYKEQQEKKTVEEDTKSTITPVNNQFRNDCTNMFPDEDMDKLRKKMVSQSTDDKMITAAKKFIGNRCVSTAQVKALSGLFLNDESRYNLFTQFYPSVNDYGNYNQLSTMLLDNYYKNRFQALIQQK